jgi:hypothetical protein
MVRKMVELPKFLMFNSGTNSIRNNSIFTFYLLIFALYRFLYPLLSFGYGVSDMFISAFQMELNDYPNFNLAEDGRLCSMGQHCPRFPRVLYDTLIRVGYDGDALIYCCRLSTAHGMDQCEVSVTIPFDPTWGSAASTTIAANLGPWPTIPTAIIPASTTAAVQPCPYPIAAASCHQATTIVSHQQLSMLQQWEDASSGTRGKPTEGPSEGSCTMGGLHQLHHHGGDSHRRRSASGYILPE